MLPKGAAEIQGTIVKEADQSFLKSHPRKGAILISANQNANAANNQVAPLLKCPSQF